MTSPESTVEIRAATVSDRAAACRLLTAQLKEHDLPIDPDGIARGVELALASSSRAWLLLATRSGMPVGILLANPIVSVEKGGAALWVEELYVTPSQRGRGVGRALMEFVIREARNNGMSAVELEVVNGHSGGHSGGHSAAMALYEKLGFKALARTRFSLG